MSSADLFDWTDTWTTSWSTKTRQLAVSKAQGRAVAQLLTHYPLDVALAVKGFYRKVVYMWDDGHELQESHCAQEGEELITTEVPPNLASIRLREQLDRDDRQKLRGTLGLVAQGDTTNGVEIKMELDDASFGYSDAYFSAATMQNQVDVINHLVVHCKMGLAKKRQCFELACEYHRERLVSCLLAHGLGPRGEFAPGIPTAVRCRSPSILQLLLDKGHVVAEHPQILSKAAEKKSPECMKILLLNGAKVNAVDTFDETALHDAAMGGSLECIQILFEAGAAVAKRHADGGPRMGELHRAAARGNGHCFQIFIDHGADPEALDGNGRSVAAVAATYQGRFEDYPKAMHVLGAAKKEKKCSDELF